MLTPYEGYILERCRQGYWNAMGLWREVVSLGYPGKYKNVSRLVAHLRKLSEEGASAHEVQASLEGLTPRKALGLLLKRTEDRSEGQQFILKALLTLHPEIEGAVKLFEDFARIVRNQASEELEEWMEGFVTKLRQDIEAVLAGIELPFSQGQTEGQVTKLKLIRRQMYGRGKFDLLRKRVLRAA